jgi:hypothetical protein
MLRRLTLFLLFALPVFAQVPLTIVSDKLYSADGSLMNGQLFISWTQFQITISSTTYTIGAGRKSCPITAGSLLCPLAPTVGSTPTTVYAVYAVTTGSTTSSAWNVPSSSTPVNLSTVTVPFVPAVNTQVSLGQLMQSGATNGQVLTWTGSAWGPGNGGGGGSLSSVFGRTGAVTAQSNDYSFSQLSGTASLSQLAQGGAVTSQILAWNGTSWAPANQLIPVTSLFGRTGVVTAQSNDYAFNQISGNVSMAQIAQAGASTGQALMWTGSIWAPSNPMTFGTTSGTAAQGNDSRITGAEQTSNKDTTSGYAGLTGGLLKLTEFPAPFNAFQGNGSMVQLAAGTAVSGDCPQYDSFGNLVDSGNPCAVGGGVSAVNGTGNISSTGGSSPTISISPTPAFTSVATGTSPPPKDWFTGTGGADIMGDGTCTGTIPSAVSALADCAGIPTWMTVNGNTPLLQGATGPVNVSALPACSSTSEGQRAAVNNSNASSFTAGVGAVVAGGGSTHVPVYCDGTNWRIE